MDTIDTPIMTASDMGKKGGATTRERYGTSFYGKINGGNGARDILLAKYGPDYYKKIRQIGIKKRKQQAS